MRRTYPRCTLDNAGGHRGIYVVKLITRYVVREHVGPLVFALTALTSLLMLQYVARQLANLAGKGLPWSVIWQFFYLSLPFTIAMTMPMAVLVATLYAFGRMAAEHEITALKASGVRVRALVLPVMVGALLLSLGMVAFNDQVMPRANHRLRILQQDISRTKPTLALRDQVLNALTDQFYMRVGRSDAVSNKMWDVTIYDLSRGPERKTIYADSGLFSLAPNGRDLQMELFDGSTQEFVRGDARRLQRSFFRTQTVRVRGISRGFESSQSDSYKGDREMTICEMQRKYVVNAIEFERIRQDFIGYLSRSVPKGTKTITVPRPRPKRDALANFYCSSFASLRQLLIVKVAQAQEPPKQQPPKPQQPGQQPAQQPAQPPPTVKPGPPAVVKKLVLPSADNPDGEIKVISTEVAPAVVAPVPPIAPAAVVPGSVGQPAVPGAAVPPATSMPGAPSSVPSAASPSPAVNLSDNVDSLALFRGATLAATTQMSDARASLDELSVEIQKKFALSFACVIFVLFGPPVALRFPRGGVGVTLGVSIVVFGLYYICLMAGEALADKGRLPAIVAMWIANVIFGLAGLVLLWRVESTTDTSRGGGIRDWWADRRARASLRALERAEHGAAVASAGGA